MLIAALLGAEEYGFGTAALVAIGCDMARQCHLDTCPTGIATQREDLRAKFSGTPEQVVTFFTAIAEDIRRELAAAGFTSLDDAIGRVDRLSVIDGAPLELERLVRGPAWSVPLERRDPAVRRRAVARAGTPASELEAGLVASLGGLRAGSDRGAVGAGDDGRAGTRCAGQRRPRAGARPGPAPPGAVHLRLTGAAGQSLGAFLSRGSGSS